MSSMSPVAPHAAPETPVANDAWYLHSQGRRFGPLDEDGMRGYFRAGMVKTDDTIAVAGQVGTLPAEAVATLLGESAPVRASAPLSPSTTIVYTPLPASSNHLGWLLPLGAIAAIAGAVYFSWHVPLKPEAGEAPRIVFAPPAQAEPSALPEDAAEAPLPHLVSVEPSRQTAGASVASNSSSAATPAAAAAPAVAGSPQAQRSAGDDWYTKATSFARANDWTGLAAHATQWSASQPGNDQAWWFLGLAKLRLGSDAEAEAALNKALQIAPRNFDARWSLANVYLGTSRHREASALLQELGREQPGNSGVWNDLGVAMDQAGEFDEAEAAFQRALKLEPNYRMAWVNLARCYAHFGHLDRAKAAAAKANAL